MRVILTSGLIMMAAILFAQSDKNKVPDSIMQKIYEEVKTPFKYGLLFQPADKSKKIDCPSVFRKRDKWYMTYLI